MADSVTSTIRHIDLTSARMRTAIRGGLLTRWQEFTIGV